MKTHAYRCWFTICLVAVASCLFITAARCDPAPSQSPAPMPNPASGVPNPPRGQAPAGPRLRYRIVVDQGKWDQIHTDTSGSLPPDVCDGIQAQLVDKLQKSGYFIVLDRESTQQQTTEASVDAAKQSSQPAGAPPLPVRQKTTAANYIITPSVIGFSQTSGKGGGFNLGSVSLGGGKSEATLTLNIRISDAQTSTVIDSQTAMGKADAKSVHGGFSFGGGSVGGGDFEKSPAGQAVDQALDDAVAKVVERLSKEPWTALVAAEDTDTNTVIINAGDLAGVTTGLTFDVFRAGHPILDPDTGEVISAGEMVKVGQIRVARVEHSASFCDIVSGSDFKTRDIVKFTP